MAVSGSNDAPGQLMPPTVLPTLIAPAHLSLGLTAGMNGVGSQRYRFRLSSAVARSAGVKSIRSSTVTCVRAYGGGIVGIGCVGDVFSPGMSLCGTAFSGIGQIG